MKATAACTLPVDAYSRATIPVLMAGPSNRIVPLVALIGSAAAAVASILTPAPWDMALVVAAAMLAAFALVSGLASRTA